MHRLLRSLIALCLLGLCALTGPNNALADAPEQVNGEPYAAWFFKLQPSNPAELEALLDAAGYQAVCSADA